MRSHLGPETGEYVTEVTGRLRALLGGRLRSVVLVGSGALGDFRADRSDVDLQVVTTERLEPRLRDRVANELDHRVLPCPARGLELVAYAEVDLPAPGGPAYQINLNTGRGIEGHVSFDPAGDPRFWFVIDADIARTRGIHLVGPSPECVFPQLPRNLLGDALEAALAWYGTERLATELTFAACRTWAWAVEGRWRSKDESARWALARLDDPTPAERALRVRSGPGSGGPTEEEAAILVQAAHAALRDARRG